jgi:hypothetical protein
VVALPSGAAFRNALRRIDEIRTPGDGVALTTRLRAPLTSAPTSDRRSVASAEPRSPAATHVVADGIAHRIPDGRLVVGAEPAGGGLRLGASPGVLPEHLSLERRRDGRVELRLLGEARVTVDGRPAGPRAILDAGARLQLGDRPVELFLVALAQPDPHGA